MVRDYNENLGEKTLPRSNMYEMTFTWIEIPSDTNKQFCAQNDYEIEKKKKTTNVWCVIVIPNDAFSNKPNNNVYDIYR